MAVTLIDSWRGVATALLLGALPFAVIAAPPKDRVRGGVTLDNSSIQLLGRSQLATKLALANPTGLKDQLALDLSSTPEQLSSRERSQSAGVSWNVPWRDYTLSLSVGRNRLAQKVQGPTVQFLASSQSDNVDVRLQRTVWSSRASRLGLYTALASRSAESFAGDDGTSPQRDGSTALSVGMDFRHQFSRHTLLLQLGHKRGIYRRGAQGDPPDAGRGGPTLRPRTWLLGTTFSGPLREAKAGAQPVNFSSSARVQYTSRRALGVDQFAIGGPGSVRGFDGQTVLAAESGAVWRNEFITPVVLPKLPLAAAFLALDCGRVWGPSAVALAGRYLAGLAVGLRGRAGAIAYDFGLGTPLSRPDGFRSRVVSLHTNVAFAF